MSQKLKELVILESNPDQYVSLAFHYSEWDKSIDQIYNLMVKIIMYLTLFLLCADKGYAAPKPLIAPVPLRVAVEQDSISNNTLNPLDIESDGEEILIEIVADPPDPEEVCVPLEIVIHSDPPTDSDSDESQEISVETEEVEVEIEMKVEKPKLVRKFYWFTYK